MRQVLSVVADVSDRHASPLVARRRPGDPAAVVADVSAIRRDLGWTARRDLVETVRSAWSAWQASAHRRSGLIPA